jgi:hypothetical protein
VLTISVAQVKFYPRQEVSSACMALSQLSAAIGLKFFLFMPNLRFAGSILAK